MKKYVAAVLASCIWAIGLAGCGAFAPQSAPEPSASRSAANPSSQRESPPSEMEEKPMIIRVTAGEITIVYELNDSQAAKELYAQLPLTLEVENFGTNEKIFYPPGKLGTAGTPTAAGGKGTLAYYAPWGDVVMFYDRFAAGGGLYELGRVVSGEELIKTLTGIIVISAGH